MTIDELKEWMDERFRSLDKRLDCINGKVTTHDRWLWLIRGIGTAILVVLGIFGIKLFKIS